MNVEDDIRKWFLERFISLSKQLTKISGLTQHEAKCEKHKINMEIRILKSAISKVLGSNNVACHQNRHHVTAARCDIACDSTYSPPRFSPAKQLKTWHSDEIFVKNSSVDHFQTLSAPDSNHGLIDPKIEAHSLSVNDVGNLSYAAPTLNEARSLDNKIKLIASLLSMMGNDDLDEMTLIMLEISRSQDGCVALRQLGCISMLSKFLHAHRDGNYTKNHDGLKTYASAALRNIVEFNADAGVRKMELHVFQLMEELRMYAYFLTSSNNTDSRNDKTVLPCSSASTLMRLSFDEKHQTIMNSFGALIAMSDLLSLMQEQNGCRVNDREVTLRRYLCMILTNLTFGNDNNKALLCSMKSNLSGLILQLLSNSEDLVQVSASVLRNLSWKASDSTKSLLNNSGCIDTLLQTAMRSRKETSLKSILSALWNLSAHSTDNKSKICSATGALEFLVSILSCRSPKMALVIVENAGGILRNVSSYAAVHEECRMILRKCGCLSKLVRHLTSPSLTIVSNSCCTLWNLSARNPEDQRTLRDLGAVNMLKKLIHSKHKLISISSAATLRNLLKFSHSSVNATIYSRKAIGRRHSDSAGQVELHEVSANVDGKRIRSHDPLYSDEQSRRFSCALYKRFSTENGERNIGRLLHDRHKNNSSCRNFSQFVPLSSHHLSNMNYRKFLNHSRLTTTCSVHRGRTPYPKPLSLCTFNPLYDNDKFDDEQKLVAKKRDLIACCIGNINGSENKCNGFETSKRLGLSVTTKMSPEIFYHTNNCGRLTTSPNWQYTTGVVSSDASHILRESSSIVETVRYNNRKINNQSKYMVYNKRVWQNDFDLDLDKCSDISVKFQELNNETCLLSSLNSKVITSQNDIRHKLREKSIISSLNKHCNTKRIPLTLSYFNVIGQTNISFTKNDMRQKCFKGRVFNLNYSENFSNLINKPNVLLMTELTVHNLSSFLELYIDNDQYSPNRQPHLNKSRQLITYKNTLKSSLQNILNYDVIQSLFVDVMYKMEEIENKLKVGSNIHRRDNKIVLQAYINGFKITFPFNYLHFIACTNNFDGDEGNGHSLNPGKNFDVVKYTLNRISISYIKVNSSSNLLTDSLTSFTTSSCTRIWDSQQMEGVKMCKPRVPKNKTFIIKSRQPSTRCANTNVSTPSRGYKLSPTTLYSDRTIAHKTTQRLSSIGENLSNSSNKINDNRCQKNFRTSSQRNETLNNNKYNNTRCNQSHNSIVNIEYHRNDKCDSSKLSVLQNNQTEFNGNIRTSIKKTNVLNKYAKKTFSIQERRCDSTRIKENILNHESRMSYRKKSKDGNSARLQPELQVKTIRRCQKTSKG